MHTKTVNLHYSYYWYEVLRHCVVCSVLGFGNKQAATIYTETAGSRSTTQERFGIYWEPTGVLGVGHTLTMLNSFIVRV